MYIDNNAPSWNLGLDLRVHTLKLWFWLAKKFMQSFPTLRPKFSTSNRTTDTYSVYSRFNELYKGTWDKYIESSATRKSMRNDIMSSTYQTISSMQASSIQVEY